MKTAHLLVIGSVDLCDWQTQALRGLAPASRKHGWENHVQIPLGKKAVMNLFLPDSETRSCSNNSIWVCQWKNHYNGISSANVRRWHGAAMGKSTNLPHLNIRTIQCISVFDFYFLNVSLHHRHVCKEMSDHNPHFVIRSNVSVTESNFLHRFPQHVPPSD